VRDLILLICVFIAGVLAGLAYTQPTKTCYVTSWKQVKQNGQTWKEPETTVCVKGDGE